MLINLIFKQYNCSWYFHHNCLRNLIIGTVYSQSKNKSIVKKTICSLDLEPLTCQEQLCGEDSIMRTSVEIRCILTIPQELDTAINPYVYACVCVVNVNLRLLFCTSYIYSVHVLLTVLYSYTCTVIQVRSIPEAVSCTTCYSVHRLCFWADQQTLAYLVTHWAR